MSDIKLFEAKKVRTHWDEEKELWFFSVIDVIEALTGTDRPRKYWSDLKAKLAKEGSQLSDNIGQLKMPAEDGRMRLTDVADTAQILRLIQSIPSPKAELPHRTSMEIQLRKRWCSRARTPTLNTSLFVLLSISLRLCQTNVEN